MIAGKVLGEKYIINGTSADVSDYSFDMSVDIYYEVVRLMDGKFLFLQDHLDRLQRSVSGSGLTYPGSNVIRENLRLLQQANSFTVGNVRICIQKKNGEGVSLLCYYIPYFYPEERTYKSGVQLVTYPHERPNPGIKKWDDRFRVSVNNFIRDHGVYEAVLCNSQKQITEGSRSNIFFLNSNNQLITPPESDVLPGITRNYVWEICKQEGIEVIQRAVHLNELAAIPTCFISGTSPKILPVRQLDGMQFNVDHPILHLLMERFESLIKENLTSLI
ncbi:MAG: aminotransferase class IV [Bacteroidota bacterium]